MNNDRPEGKPEGNGGAPGGGSSSSVSHSGVTTFDSDTTANGVEYKSETGGQSAVLVTKGAVNLDNVTVNKTGDESSENSDFYGTNAAVIATGGTLDITNSSIVTNAAHGNAVFSYGEGIVTISNSKISTTGNNSGGIMVTGGGTLTANDLTVTTTGNSSAAIRSDRGGGTMIVTGGTYQTSGVGSPVIYSTANVVVNDATLTATASEGVVIEGLNTVTLKNVRLTDTNNTLNGNSETYKNIFIYQSMSGDAEEGTGVFWAENSVIVTNKGDSFFVTNTTAVINLKNNAIINNDSTGVLLRAQSGKWGTSGKNGGQVTVTAEEQNLVGDIVIDAVSSLDLQLTGKSYYKGMISGEGTRNVALSADSVMVLTGDVTLTSLTDEDSSYSNIYLNGHTLTVNGVAIAGNTGEAPAEPEVNLAVTEEGSTETGDECAQGVDCSNGNTATNSAPQMNWWLIGGIVAAAAVVVTVILVWLKKTGRIGKKGGDNVGTYGGGIEE